jgi:mycothiol synthase
MLSPSFRAARRARVAILHALGAPSADAYRPLLDAARAALEGQADDCYLFLPEELGATREAFEDLGFRFERTAYLMTAPTYSALSLAKAKADLPAGYGLRALEKPGQATGEVAGGAARLFPEGLEDFVAVRNRNFRELQGSMDTRPEDLLEFMDAAEYLPGGLMLALSPDGAPCGTLRVERDDEEGSGFIGTISVDREHRGKGLARALVRMALAFCRQAGFREAGLSVNAENRNALRLYESEGFSVVKAMSCLSLVLR